jgi:hypothetical protein
VLKVPEFAEALPALLRTWPDARVVVAQRDPEEVADSAASLVAAQMAPQTDNADYAAIRAEWARKTALRELRIATDLKGCANPIAAVDFRELDADWQSAVREVYRALGLPLSDDAVRAMQRTQRTARHDALQEHRRQRQSFTKEATR